MLMILRLIRESYIFAFQAIIVNKVRTILSLLGITIGIFCVISVFTIFDSMENSIRKSIASLGSNVLFVQKWPWSMGGDYPWWKYWQRPEASMEDMRELEKRSTLSETVAFMVQVNKTVKYQSNYIENIGVTGVSHEFDKVWRFELGEGRYFSATESASGKNIAVIGADIASELFREGDPVGKKIKIFGRNIEVVGVISKEGEDFFGNSNDKVVYLPINYFKTLVDIRDMDATIVVKARPLVSNDELRDELTGLMRSIRKIKPSAEDNFAINETDIISKGFDSLFRVIATVGWIVGGFSLLVGGFGIANIMFVSVRERTNIIGIQKALGAKNYFILLQFLFEAVFLSLIGGIFGLLIILLLTLIVSYATKFTLILTTGNILLGILVSASIGLISGIVPAWSASKLDPVEAMRTGI
ncbi:MAG TPA: ABC transporter permease [Bacteroidales bacterium]|nr:ABC transporter permease [Bacteroidales bacterium]HPS62196.1 ABC transporter permease [Bacteroidales bacterium]